MEPSARKGGGNEGNSFVFAPPVYDLRSPPNASTTTSGNDAVAGRLVDLATIGGAVSTEEMVDELRTVNGEIR